MLRSLLLASAFALAAPAVAQEMTDDTAPPTTDSGTTTEVQDETAIDTSADTMPMGTDEEMMDHSTMSHDATGTTSATTDVNTADTGVSDTMTTTTTAETTVDTDADAGVPATPTATADTAVETDADASTATPTATADADTSTSATAAATGMGGPIDIQTQWASFDTVGDGLLTPLEFARWVSSSMGQPMSSDMTAQAVELLNASADELALVDTNNDWHVSRDELAAAAPQ